MSILIVSTLLAVVMTTPVYAQVHVDIGIHFPAPPPLVVVPETPRVQYVPTEPTEAANLFLYNGQYWAFANGEFQCGTTTSRLDTGAGGKTASLRAGMRTGGASGPTSEGGEAANTNGRTNKARGEGAATEETDSAAPDG